MKKIVVSDYDKTFYINDLDIEENKRQVKKFMNLGNIFIFATGRSYVHFNPDIHKYNLKYDYLILDHGALVLDSKDNIIFNFNIDDNIIFELKKDLCLEESVSYFCSSIFEGNVSFEHKNISKINVRYKTKEETLKINNIINNKYSKYINSYFVREDCIEIISNKTSKYMAIKMLIDNLNLKCENVFTIGDGYSDIEMIKKYNGFCMKESVEELKNISKRKFESVSILINEILK